MSFRITQLRTVVVDANLKLIVTFAHIFPTYQALKIINK